MDLAGKRMAHTAMQSIEGGILALYALGCECCLTCVEASRDYGSVIVDRVKLFDRSSHPTKQSTIVIHRAA